MDLFVKAAVVILSLLSSAKIAALYIATEESVREKGKKLRLFFTGFLAGIADTFGIGSFSVIVAINSGWKLIDCKRLPGTMNAQGTLPGMVQSLLFLNFIEIEISLLAICVAATSMGGFLSAYLVSSFDKQRVRAVMSAGFAATALLLLAKQLDSLPLGGEATNLEGGKLIAGTAALFFIGALPAIGVSFYVPIQLALFLLGLSPLIAFPIMTTAGAIVQSTTAFAFAKRGEVAAKESLMMVLPGIAGVAVAAPLIAYTDLNSLRWLLLLIVSYNAFALYRDYRLERARGCGSIN